MSAIPDRIAVLDSTRKRVETLKRTDDKELCEADCDRLIVENADLIADALTHAGVLEEGSELLLIATQFECIDVLFAEVHSGELRRIVVVEDKLHRNPQAHREVLAQVLEYANNLQYEIEVDAVIEKAQAETRHLLADHRDDLERILRNGDFLLLICGDRLRPRLIELVKPMLDRRANALSRFEMALVSLALYKGGEQTILVPNVVGSIARAEREMTVQVVVTTDSGAPINARAQIASSAVAAATPMRPRGAQWTRETFFDELVREASDDGREPMRRAFTRLLAFAEANPSLGIRWGTGKVTATFMIFTHTKDGDVTLMVADAYGNLQVYSRPIGAVIGDEVAKREVAALATALDRPMKHEQSYPYLPEHVTTTDEKPLVIVETWLQRVADAVNQRVGAAAPNQLNQ